MGKLEVRFNHCLAPCCIKRMRLLTQGCQRGEGMAYLTQRTVHTIYPLKMLLGQLRSRKTDIMQSAVPSSHKSSWFSALPAQSLSFLIPVTAFHRLSAGAWKAVSEADHGCMQSTAARRWESTQALPHLLACPITFHLEFCICRSEKDPEEETVKPWRKCKVPRALPISPPQSQAFLSFLLLEPLNYGGGRM